MLIFQDLSGEMRHLEGPDALVARVDLRIHRVEPERG
jgi:hypothetical protein